MKYSKLLLICSGALLLFSCNKHEVVPAPVPKVDLYCHFEGKINNTFIELTQNVDGYDCVSTKLKTIQPSGSQSYAIYYSTMRSESYSPYVKLALGNLYYDATLSNDPPLAQFNQFFGGLSNIDPPYTMDAQDGFMVEYRDAQGNIWNSVDTTNALPQDVHFTSVRQESDASGDYIKFICEFNCYVYRFNGTTTDSLLIKDAHYEGWYRR